MKCSECGINIPKEFVHAIRSNKCPACSKNIMKAEQLVAYSGLKELLKPLMQEEDSEKVVSLILANFELKQMFKSPAATDVEKPISQAIVKAEMPVETEEDIQEPVVDEEGIRLEVIPKNKSQAMLQQMRDNALKNALDERYGVDFGDDNEVLLAEDPKANAELLKQEYKRASAQKLVSEGVGGGTFRRSGQ